MRYERLRDIVTLAIRMQGLRAGMTLDDIRVEFGVSRRTAERMRDAVEWAFGPPLIRARPGATGGAPTLRRSPGYRPPSWRTSRPRQTPWTPPGSASALHPAGMHQAAPRCGDSAGTLPTSRCWPRPRGRHASRSQAATRQASLDESPRGHRDLPIASFNLSQSTGRRSRRIEPYGLLYGNRAFLVGRGRTGDMRLWRAN